MKEGSHSGWEFYLDHSQPGIGFVLKFVPSGC